MSDDDSPDDSPDDSGVPPEFARRAAHEVRSPLGVVIGALEQIALRVDESDAETRRWIDLGQRSTHRLLRLAERMEWISRAHAGLASPPGDGSLAEIVGRAVRAAELSAGRRRIEVQTHVEGDMPVAAPEALTHAIGEVVHNGISHARARVEVRMQVEGDQASILVRDDGRGFEDKGWVERLPPSERSGSGLGLGLWLARRLLAAIGGSIVVSETGAEGSLVRIELRRA